MRFVKKHLKLITIMIVMIVIAGAIGLKYYLLKEKKVDLTEEPLEEEEELIFSEPEEPLDEEVITTVYVDIKGAVVNPGVYEIEEDKKVIDVITLAGGLSENADTSLVNLAKTVSNEMVVIIYTIDEVKRANDGTSVAKIVDSECVCPSVSNDACLYSNSTSSSSSSDSASNDTTTSEKVNINTATASELETLPGIGESKAEAIISYREENGNFSTIEDIQNVSGIGEALYEKIKDYITV